MPGFCTVSTSVRDTLTGKNKGLESPIIQDRGTQRPIEVLYSNSLIDGSIMDWYILCTGE